MVYKITLVAYIFKSAKVFGEIKKTFPNHFWPKYVFPLLHLKWGKHPIYSFYSLYSQGKNPDTVHTHVTNNMQISDYVHITGYMKIAMCNRLM